MFHGNHIYSFTKTYIWDYIDGFQCIVEQECQGIKCSYEVFKEGHVFGI